MEKLVELMLISIGAPAAFDTPIVVAVIVGGWAQSLYKTAKESFLRWGRSIWDEGEFILSLGLAIVVLSLIWAAFQVLLAIEN